jgi:hypothetical protein
MNKSLFVLIPLFVSLTSCSHKASFETERSALHEKDPSAFLLETDAYFSTDINYAIEEGKYYYRFSLFDVKEDQKNARVILSDGSKDFFTGYENTIHLVNSKEKKDSSNHFYLGLAINFSLDKKIDKMIAFFASDEIQELYFQITID